MTGSTVTSPPRSAAIEVRTGLRRMRRRRRQVLVVVASGLAAGLVAGLVVLNIWLRIEHRDTVRQLDATQGAIAALDQDLERALTKLQLLTDQVSRAEQASGLAQLDLGRIQGTLASAQEALAAQGIHVNALTTCLEGVRTAVAHAGAGNNAAAVDALRDVDGNCNRALTTVGGTGPVYALDFADPFVLTTADGYYAYATNSGGGDVQVIRSPDLHEWEVIGNGLAALPGWAEANLTWAPAVLPRRSRFVLYYTVREASTDRQCISRAVASDPGGPFVDDSASPLRCAGGGDIDPSPFVGPNGRAFLLWRSDGSPLRITAQALSADGLSLVGEPHDLVVADRPWEEGTVEGPAMVWVDGRFHLFYSGNDWNSRGYGIGHAVCASPLGPCAKTGDGPLLATNGSVAGPGGQEVFLDGAGGVRLAYHAFTEPYVGYPASRRLHLATVSFSGRRAVIAPG